MADAMVERRPTPRFFCHRCNLEFEDVLQDFTCPYCASGFIEQLEIDTDNSVSGDTSDLSDADMSNLDDSDEFHQTISHPMLNDLAFLMSGGRLRSSGRPETFLEQLVWSLTGGATGATTAGAPLVVVGAPGDYVVGGEGLDAVVTQLLGQLENAGPPPLPRDQLAALPREPVTPGHAAVDATCSVCWETFKQGEQISRLECEHTFHSACIEPWLRLHATCPICRRSLLPPGGAGAPAADSGATPGSPVPAAGPNDPSDTTRITIPRLVVRRIGRRAPLRTQTWDSPRLPDPAATAAGAATVSTTGVWAAGAGRGRGVGRGAGATRPPASSSSSGATSAPSSASLDSADTNRSYNMDIDFD